MTRTKSSLLYADQPVTTSYVFNDPSRRSWPSSDDRTLLFVLGLLQSSPADTRTVVLRQLSKVVIGNRVLELTLSLQPNRNTMEVLHVHVYALRPKPLRTGNRHLVFSR